jgi:hypothetical protein
MKAARWPSLVAQFSPVMRLIHGAMRMNEDDVQLMAKELFEARKTEFNAALDDYISQAGCAGSSDLKTRTELDFLRQDSQKDAQSIIDTYNMDLAKTIQKIKVSTPRANRNTYASGLRNWEAGRKSWKATQIALWTTLTARDQALKSFAFHNKLRPKVRLMPRTAAEPICQGWINRGLVSFQIAVNNRSPFHLNCIHFWEPQFDPADCEGLWSG